MKRIDDDVAQSLLDGYLAHVEKLRNEAPPPSDDPNVVIVDVMRSSRLVRRAVEAEIGPKASS